MNFSKLGTALLSIAVTAPLLLPSTASAQYTSDPNKVEVIGKVRHKGVLYAFTNLRCPFDMPGKKFAVSRFYPDMRTNRGCGVSAGDGFDFTFIVNERTGAQEHVSVRQND
ncbi:hypothetical protein ACFIQG_18800 [Comamonas odontotermitis]|uniref:hypothetical protein n=1 Tax=Comamonas odontotermitis TaxID=379895 RepID=UPI00366C2D0F